MRPYDAKTEAQQLDLVSDNHQTKSAWILLGFSQVSIATQKVGESATGLVKIPRGEFNRLIDWYMKDQKIRKRKSTPRPSQEK